MTSLIATDYLHDPGAWVGEALCAQAWPDAWFPEAGQPGTSAKAICRRCPVRAACLEYALENRETFGIWGGTSERERRHLLDARASAVDKTGHHQPPARVA